MTNRNYIEQLFKSNYDRMYRLAITLLHDEDLAHDMVHEVFAALLDSVSGQPVGVAYLLKAVKNRCLTHIRNCGIHQRIENRYFVENKEYEDDDWPDDDTIAYIHSLISSDLTPQARRVMQLRFSDGLQFAKIANIMGISQAAVFRHLSTALKTIRLKLNQNG